MRCMGRAVGCALLLVGLAVAAWFFREPLFDAWADLRGGGADAAAASPRLADQAEEKLARLAGPEPPDRVALNNAELQSLLQYRIAQQLPGFVLDPTVSAREGRLFVQARVPTGEVAGMPGVPGSELLEILPDTTDVEVKGHLIPLSSSRVALAVDEVTAATIPLPRRVIPRLLAQVGRVDEPGVPREALPLSLPDGASAAYVDGDSLVIVGDTTDENPPR